jgi:Rrf2 family protein
MWRWTAGQCALRAMADMALHGDEGSILCKDIAGRLRISHQYLSRLLCQLERAELVHSIRSMEEGYTLARDADQITVGDIRLAVAETLDPAFCVNGKCQSLCQAIESCPADWLSPHMGQAVHEIWDSITLADLCTERFARQRSSEFSESFNGVRKRSDTSNSIDSKDALAKYFAAFDSLETLYAFHQSIVDGIAEPILVIGTDYRIKLVNRAAHEFISSGIDVSEPTFCFKFSHRRETPCDGVEHPCPLQRVLESRQPVTVVHEHYRTDGERRLVELVASPLWGADGECQGIIESAHDITERRNAERALQQYAERLRVLAEQLSEVSEMEREQLARELHDRVGQNLTVLGINLNIVRTQMPEDVAPVVRSRLDDSLLLVQQTTERIRDVMADLRPPVLDDYGLVSALHWYAEQFSRRTELAVAVEYNEPVPRLDGRVETALFRIAQEALTNVAKHAHASQVTVRLEVGRKNLRLIVADDGIGFDPGYVAESGQGRGWGLLSMSERAEAVGGHCLIEASPGVGTRVIVEIAR